MTTTAFALLFLPACLAVPAGLALGAVAEFLIERIGAVIAPPTPRAAAPQAARPPRRFEGRGSARGLPAPAATVAEGRREPGWLGLRGGLDAPARRDEMAFLNARRPVGSAPWM